jgi:hypothetical protein
MKKDSVKVGDRVVVTEDFVFGVEFYKGLEGVFMGVSKAGNAKVGEAGDYCCWRIPFKYLEKVKEESDGDNA